MQLIDIYVYINFDVFNFDLEEVCKCWEEVGVVYLVYFCVGLDEFFFIKVIVDCFLEFFYVVGLYFLDVYKWIFIIVN